MDNIRVSAGQLLADYIYRGVEVIAEPTEKTRYGTDEQQVKGDFRAWIVPVAVPRGKLVEECRVTFWSTTRPPVHEGDLARFREVIFGAVEGHLYTQAYRVEVLDDDES